nr:ABC transporter ATP-binding protein [Rhizobium laguerreae]
MANNMTGLNMMTDTQAGVSVRDLSIRYGDHTVLDNMDIDIKEGEFVVLLGPSGCGKSTLLNAIAGLGAISDGEVWISGRNVTWEEPSRRGIGMVFQSYALYPQMTVEGNMSFGLRMARTSKHEIRRRVDEAARILQLQPLLNRKPAALSGGQRQRVAIGRALVRDVDVYLFDEPLSNLDAKLRAELRVELKRIYQELRKTMIYVTHDQVEALTLADRIAIMKNGVIQQIGTPADVYRRPQNLFVAGFIGTPSMNLINGRIERRGGRFCFVSEAGSLTISVGGYGSSFDLAEGPVLLGVRPEHIGFSTAAIASNVTNPFKVQIVEPMGSETIIYGTHDGIPLVIRANGETDPAPGTDAVITIDADHINLFDEASGNRL